MAEICGFPPVENKGARVLILGSMPGEASLQADRYYAHPQNAFWPIMCSLLRADPDQPYRARLALLKKAGIALWDVVASCERDGSLDADIRHDSVVVNDFATFFATHPKITDVLFNGGMAETCFRRYVAPNVDCPIPRLERLPSTSPANASLSRAKKLAAWRKALADRGIITDK